ncbi:hypothetical protein LINPERHAP2_LOCUS37015 [Linum perenne]
MVVGGGRQRGGVGMVVRGRESKATPFGFGGWVERRSAAVKGVWRGSKRRVGGRPARWWRLVGVVGSEAAKQSRSRSQTVFSLAAGWIALCVRLGAGFLEVARRNQRFVTNGSR